MLYGDHLGRVHSFSVGSGWAEKPSVEKNVNFVLEIAHFAENVICVRKISRVPKSEGEPSLVPFESATYKNAAYLSPSGFVKYSIKAPIEYWSSKSSDGAAPALARSTCFD